MPVTPEMPISEKDIALADEQTLSISKEKFDELLGYLEHLEDVVTSLEFDQESERRLSQFLSSFAIRMFVMGSRLYDLARRYQQEHDEQLEELDFVTLCTSQIDRLINMYSHGEINEEQFEVFIEPLQRVSSYGESGATLTDSVVKDLISGYEPETSVKAGEISFDAVNEQFEEKSELDKLLERMRESSQSRTNSMKSSADSE